MKLESALELKSALMAGTRRMVQRAAGEVRGAAAPPGPATRAARTLGRRLDAGAGLAMGVAPMTAKASRARGAREFKLAVRVMHARAKDLSVLLAPMAKLSPTEVEVVDGLEYTKRDALEAGTSCGHYRTTAGTLGMFVEDDERSYVLSNNHVLADSDRGSKGDAIWAPAPDDVKRGKYMVIARLARWPKLRRTRRDNLDVALAELTEQVDEFYAWWYEGIGEMDPRPIDDLYAVQRVVKLGRTSGVTRGRVSAFELDGITIDYALPAGVITFDDQLELIHETPAKKDFSAGGDSGSLILDAETLRPYALLYGGGPDGNGIDRTLAHFLQPVLEKLKVRPVS
jgi:hypothetical protein